MPDLNQSIAEMESHIPDARHGTVMDICRSALSDAGFQVGQRLYTDATAGLLVTDVLSGIDYTLGVSGPCVRLMAVHGAFAHTAEVTSPRRIEGLSPMQIKVAELVGRGLINKVIANRLGITEATVKTHLKGTLRILGLANRTQLAVMIANLRPSEDPALNAAE